MNMEKLITFYSLIICITATLFLTSCGGGSSEDQAHTSNVQTGVNIVLDEAMGGSATDSDTTPEICDGIDNNGDGEIDTIYGQPLQVINPVLGIIPLYKLYSEEANDHFYTTSAAEKDSTVGLGYSYEGISGYIYLSQKPDTVPLYKLYSEEANDHFYTTNADEEDAVAGGYTYEGISGYIYSSQKPDTAPLYRLYSEEANDHIHTTSAAERDNAVAGGYTYEGITGYIYSEKGTYEICVDGQWIEYSCAETEDCSNNLDNDCDGLLPEDDWGCVRRVWTKPGSSWRKKYDYDVLGRVSCDADAWNDPDFEYNPAQHSEWGMNPTDWRCISSKTYFNDAVSMFVADGWSFEDIGKAWITNHVYDSLPSIIQEILEWFLEDEIGEMKKYAPYLPEPSAWTYVYAVGTNGICYDLDSVYSFKRDWTCFHNTFQTDKVFDWHDKDGVNWVSPVKDQGSCGCCWAHSTLGAVEAKHNIKNSNPDLDIDLSEQELVSCSDAGSCDGGSHSLATDYVKDSGIRTEACFPYQGRDTSCSPSCDTKHYISGYQAIEADSEAMKLALREKGPLSVCLDWGSFMTWNGGIGKCNGQQDESGHCVTLVGYNDYDSYWIIKNSHGNWNGDGYGKIGYGECRMETSRGALFGVG